MASLSSTEPKTTDENVSETVYNVTDEDQEENDSDVDQFSRIKPRLLKTPSVLNAIIDQIHPDILAKYLINMKK